MFFRKGEAASPVEVDRSVAKPFNSAVDRLAYSMETLLAGPTEAEQAQGLYSEVPKGTQVLSVYEDSQGALRVNLSREFQSGGGSYSIQKRLEEVVTTIESLALNQPVYLEVEGEELHVLGGEGLEVEEPVVS